MVKIKQMKEDKLILPRDRDELETLVFKLSTEPTAVASPSSFSLKLSTYSSCEASELCPGKTVHRQTSNTYIPVVPMSRSSGKHPHKNSESSPTSEGMKRWEGRTEGILKGERSEETLALLVKVLELCAVGFSTLPCTSP